MRAFLAERFPAVAAAPLAGARTCRYELTPDGHFIAARHPEHPSVWLLGGGSATASSTGRRSPSGSPPPARRSAAARPLRARHPGPRPLGPHRRRDPLHLIGEHDGVDRRYGSALGPPGRSVRTAGGTRST